MAISWFFKNLTIDWYVFEILIQLSNDFQLISINKPHNFNYSTQRKCTCGPICEASDAYLNQLDEVFKYSLPKDGKLAAFFAESIQVWEIKKPIRYVY